MQNLDQRQIGPLPAFSSSRSFSSASHLNQSVDVGVCQWLPLPCHERQSNASSIRPVMELSSRYVFTGDVWAGSDKQLQLQSKATPRTSPDEGHSGTFPSHLYYQKTMMKKICMGISAASIAFLALLQVGVVLYVSSVPANQVDEVDERGAII